MVPILVQRFNFLLTRSRQDLAIRVEWSDVSIKHMHHFTCTNTLYLYEHPKLWSCLESKQRGLCRCH